MKLLVKEGYNKTNLCEFVDGSEVQEKQVNEGMLLTYINNQEKGSQLIKVEFEGFTKVRYVTIEEFDEGFDVILNTRTYDTTADPSRYEYQDSCLGITKTLKSARKKAQDYANKYDLLIIEHL